MRAITHVVVHHSLTQDGQTVDWDAIARYHTAPPPAGHGWLAIGYHLGIERHAGRITVHRGRPFDMPGAHCVEARMNQVSLGVCIVGNYDLAAPDAAIWEHAAIVVGAVARIFDVPAQRIIGHREAGALAGFNWKIPGQYKSCPGRLFDMDAFRTACLP